MLSACDLWPTTLSNDSAQPLTMRYWHANYDRWSPVMSFKAPQTIRLAAGHHLEDVACLEINEGARQFRYDLNALGGVHALCAKTRACALHYVGDGAIRVDGADGFRIDRPKRVHTAKPCWP